MKVQTTTPQIATTAAVDDEMEDTTITSVEDDGGDDDVSSLITTTKYETSENFDTTTKLATQTERLIENFSTDQIHAETVQLPTQTTTVLDTLEKSVEIVKEKSTTNTTLIPVIDEKFEGDDGSG